MFIFIVNIIHQKMNENIPSSNRIYHFFVFLILLLSTSHGQQILLHFLIWNFFAEAYSSNNYFLIWLKAKRALYVITLTPAASTVFVLRGNNVLLFFRSTDFYTDSRIKKENQITLQLKFDLENLQLFYVEKWMTPFCSLTFIT